MKRFFSQKRKEPKSRTGASCAVRAGAAMFAFFLIFSDGLSASASSLSDLQQQSEETQQAIHDLQQQRSAASDHADALSDQADALSDQADAAASRLASVQNQIAQAKNGIASASAEMDALQTELEQAQADEAEQYEAMKKRIAYSYENRKSSWLVLFLEADSFSDFLSSAEYAEQIASYDREKLEQYRQLQEEIQKKQKALSERQEELTAYQEVLGTSEQQLAVLSDAADSAASAKNAEAADANAKVADFDAQLKQLAKKKASLDSQAAAAQAAIAQQIAAEQEAEEAAGQKEDTSGSVSASDSELMLLAACIQAEADNQPYAGKLAVGSVIMNRVKSSKFPNTITGVITQNRQFASYSSGMINALIENNRVNSTCLSVAQEVVGGARNGNWLFFMTEAAAQSFGITGYEKIGDHVFFWKWGAN